MGHGFQNKLLPEYRGRPRGNHKIWVSQRRLSSHISLSDSGTLGAARHFRRTPLMREIAMVPPMSRERGVQQKNRWDLDLFFFQTMETFVPLIRIFLRNSGQYAPFSDKHGSFSPVEHIGLCKIIGPVVHVWNSMFPHFHKPSSLGDPPKKPHVPWVPL